MHMNCNIKYEEVKYISYQAGSQLKLQSDCSSAIYE